MRVKKKKLADLILKMSTIKTIHSLTCLANNSISLMELLISNLVEKVLKEQSSQETTVQDIASINAIPIS